MNTRSLYIECSKRVLYICVVMRDFQKNVFVSIGRYPLTIACTVTIIILCLIPTEGISLSVSVSDKLVHTIMFFCVAMLQWFEYAVFYRRRGQAQQRIWIWNKIAFPLVLGAVTELLQEYVTGGQRSGDWYDFWADTVGISIAAICGYLLLRQIRSWLRNKARRSRDKK